MLPKTATARNMFAIVAAGVATTVATAGILLWLSYRAVEERSISEMVNAAEASAGKVETYFAKVKALLRQQEMRSVNEIEAFFGRVHEHFPPEECRAYIRHDGYAATHLPKTL